MSEIEKMYKNAGVKKYRLLDMDNKLKWVYPKFTAEKQLSLIKFILNKYGDIGFQTMYMITGNDESTRKDYIKCLCDCEHETWDSRPVQFYYQENGNGDTFEDSIAGLINNLWQDLTEQERTEIAEILK